MAKPVGSEFLIDLFELRFHLTPNRELEVYLGCFWIALLGAGLVYLGATWFNSLPSPTPLPLPTPYGA